MIRAYDFEKDQKAVHRIWHEIGWMSSGDDEQYLDKFIGCSNVLVAELNGEAECMVMSTPGIFRHLDEDLNLSAVTAVTTSRVARKQGFAKKATAQLIASDAAQGALVSALGIFEQGFYNLLGYGSAPYENWISFDPAQLNVNTKARVPRRLTINDSPHMHHALLNRHRLHGACSLLPPTVMEAELGWNSKAFGLGYFDGPQNELTHFFYASTQGESGPYTINFIAYQTGEQLLELLALIKNLGDQVRMVRMNEPPGIQMQDFLIQPFRFRQLTDKSKYVNINRASSYWQLRICDLAGCMEKTHLQGNPVRFNLQLDDPIADILNADAPWRGVGGNYVVTLGPKSDAQPGQAPTLPTLTASVGAFSRLWMGALSASSLTISDQLAGPSELLRALDRLVCLPQPKWGWGF